jgi:hypothetical protein
MINLEAPTLLNFGLPSCSSSTKGIAKALREAQTEIEPAIKDRVNPAFRSRYADLSAVYDACIPALNRAGIAVTGPLHFYPMGNDGLLVLEMRLTHGESGEFVSSFFPVVPQKKDAQGMGSALTYARRYCLSALVCVAADDDDDGQAAVRKPALAQKEDHTPSKPVYAPRQQQAPAISSDGAPTLNAKGLALLQGINAARDLAALESFRGRINQGGYTPAEATALHEVLQARENALRSPGPTKGRAAAERALEGF